MFLPIAKDFIKKILTLDEQARMTAKQALEHTWMTSENIQDIDILETVRENFNPRRKLKSAVDAIRALNRLRNHEKSESDIQSLRNEQQTSAVTAI